jgi:hypothetical protein
MRLTNAGAALALTGGVLLVGGLVWYFVQTPTADSHRAQIWPGTVRF